MLDPSLREKGEAQLARLVKEDELHMMTDMSLHQDLKVRFRIIEHLGNFEYKTTINDLVEILKDREPVIRKAAVKALNGIKAEYKYDALIELFRNAETSIRLYAIKTTGEAEQKNAVLPLLDTLGDDNPEITYQVIDSLRYIGDSRSDAEVLKMLDNPDPSIMYAAAFYCGSRRLKKAASRLYELAGDENVNLRIASVWALDHIEGKNCSDRLREILPGETDHNVRNQILKTLNHYEHVDLSGMKGSEEFCFIDGSTIKCYSDYYE